MSVSSCPGKVAKKGAVVRASFSSCPPAVRACYVGKTAVVRSCPLVIRLVVRDSPPLYRGGKDRTTNHGRGRVIKIIHPVKGKARNRISRLRRPTDARSDPTNGILPPHLRCISTEPALGILALPRFHSIPVPTPARSPSDHGDNQLSFYVRPPIPHSCRHHCDAPTFQNSNMTTSKQNPKSRRSAFLRTSAWFIYPGYTRWRNYKKQRVYIGRTGPAFWIEIGGKDIPGSYETERHAMEAAFEHLEALADCPQ